MMKQTVSECRRCGLPCLGKSCPYYEVTILVCDECGEETELYYFETRDGVEELCLDCLAKRFEKVREEE